MVRPRQRGIVVEDPMHLSPSYKSSLSSAAICLLLSAFVLVAFFLRSAIRRYGCSSLLTTQTPGSARAMSTSKEKFLPYPTPESDPIDPISTDPLAIVYYPITSAQLAALAERNAAGLEPEPEPEQADEGSLESTGAAASTTGAESFEVPWQAYVRYFEDRQNDETWQRRIVKYDTQKEGNQNVT